MFKLPYRLMLALASLDRSWYMVVAAGAILVATALVPWSEGPSARRSFLSPSGELVLVEEPHWTELAARLLTFLGGLFFLGAMLIRRVPGRGMLLLAWIIAAFLLAFPCWLNHWAPQQRWEKRLLFGQMNRVVDEMERNSVEQQVSWRDWQRFSGKTLGLEPGTQDAEEGWNPSLLSPSRWYRVLEGVLGVSQEFLGFFRPTLLAALSGGILLLLLGLHLGSGLGVPGFRRGVAWGGAFLLGFLAVPLVPRAVSEYLMLQAVEAEHRGEPQEAVRNLEAARSWRPTLATSSSYYAQLGRIRRLQDREAFPEALVSEALGEIAAERPKAALVALYRAQAMTPESAPVRYFLGIALSEAGIDAFNIGEFSLAKDYWEESLGYLPTNPTPWYGLTLVHFRLRRFDDAARCAEQVVRLQNYLGYKRWTARSQFFVAKSWAAFSRGDWAKAHEMYTLSLTPESW